MSCPSHLLFLLLALLSLAGSPPLWAQPPAEASLAHYQYDTWSVPEGLPQVTVTAMARDRAGWLWVGTQNGLARMDGRTLVAYRLEDTPQLGSSWIVQLLTARDGSLWIVTHNSLVRWRNQQFEWLADLADLGGVTGLAEDSAGRIWLAGNGLWQVTGQGLQPHPGWQGQVQKLAATDRLWLVDDRGQLLSLDHRQASLMQPGGTLGPVRSLSVLGDAIWLGTADGLFLWRNGQLLQRSRAAVTASAEFRGELWVADEQGIGLWTGDRLRARLPRDLSPESESLVLFAFEADAFWVGTRGQGVRHYWRGAVAQFDQRQGMGTTSWSLLPDGEALLVASEQGVIRWHRDQGQLLVAADQLPGGMAYSLLRDRQGLLWVGSREGLSWFDGRRTRQLAAFSGLQINSLLELPDGRRLAASSRGLWRFDQTGAESWALADLPVRSLLLDDQQRLWAGTENGLWFYQQGHWQRVRQAPLDRDFIPALLQLPDGRLVAATYQQGIFTLAPGADQWQAIDLSRGLPTQGAFGLVALDRWLWISNGDGIQRLPLQALNRAGARIDVLWYDQGDKPGRRRIRCCNGGGNLRAVAQGGYLWFPSLAGVVRVEASTPANRVPVVDMQRVVVPEPGSPNPGDREYHYGVLDFRQPQGIEYRYRLLPYQREWRMAGNRVVAYFTNLPAGEQLFEVQARYPFDDWGPSAQQADFVAPRYWETLWFRSLLGLLLLLFAWALARLRTYRLGRREAWLKQQIHLRTAELQQANAQLASLNVRLREASLQDPLTGLHNRRYLSEQLPQLLAHLQRRRQAGARDSSMGFLMIDLDGFKAINDRFGHDAGDALLKQVALCLQGVCRESDLLMRWGGEEFMLVVPDMEPAALVALVGRIRDAMGLASQAFDKPVEVTASVGMAVHPLYEGADLKGWQLAVSLADFCLYQVKAAGRNGFASARFTGVVPAIGEGGLSHDILSHWLADGVLQLKLERWG